MILKKYPFLDKQDNTYLVNSDYINIYIPKLNFDKNKHLSSYDGDNIETIGIFNFEVLTSEDYELKKPGFFYKLNIPINIKFEFSYETNIIKKFKYDLEPVSYNVFTLIKGNKFLINDMVQLGMNTTKQFIDILHGGKIPENIEYSKIINLYNEAISIGKANLGAPSCLLETMIAELCRYKDDYNIPFRKAINSNNKLSQYDYKNIRLQELPNLNSVFTSLSFERVNDSIISSLKNQKNNVKQIESPLEKTIKY